MAQGHNNIEKHAMLSNHPNTMPQKTSSIDLSNLQLVIQQREAGDILWEEAASLPYSDEALRDSANTKYEEAFEHYTACYDAFNHYKAEQGQTEQLIAHHELMLLTLPSSKLYIAEHFYFIAKTLADAYHEMGHYRVARKLYKEARHYFEYCLSNPTIKSNLRTYLDNSYDILPNIDFNTALSTLLLAKQELKDNGSINLSPDIANEVTQIFIENLERIKDDKTAKAYQKHVAAEYILQTRIMHAQSQFNFTSSRDNERLKWCVIEILTPKQLYFLAHIAVDAPINLIDLLDKLRPQLSHPQLKQLQPFYQHPTKKMGNEPSVEEYAQQIAEKIHQFKVSDEYTKLKLLPHQQEALAKIALHFADSNTKAGITMATGTGKTHVFISILLATQAMSQNESAHKNQAFIVVPQLSLGSQTFNRIQQLLHECQLSCNIGVFNGREKSQRKITIVTLDSLQSEMRKSPKQRQLNIDRCKLIVFDEIHLALSEKCKELIFELSTNKLILTFTATDTYNTKRFKGALNSVKELIGEENCIYNYSLLQAIEDKMLAPLRVCLVNGISTIPPRFERNTTKEVNLLKIEEHLGKDNYDEINSTVVEQYLHVVHPDTKESLVGKQGFAFCVSIHHADTLVKKFNMTLTEHSLIKQSNIIPAAVISGKQSGEEQTKLLALFHEGKILLLCGADILITGIDVPNLEVIYNLRPTRSRVLAEQRLGRLTRLPPTNPKKIGLIFEYPMIAKQVLAPHFLNNKQYAGSIPELTEDVLTFSHMQIQTEQQVAGACQWTMSWDIPKPQPLPHPIQHVPMQQQPTTQSLEPLERLTEWSPMLLPHLFFPSRQSTTPPTSSPIEQPTMPICPRPSTATPSLQVASSTALPMQPSFFASTQQGYKRYANPIVYDTSSKRPRLESTTLAATETNMSFHPSLFEDSKDQFNAFNFLSNTPSTNNNETRLDEDEEEKLINSFLFGR